jgi:1-acyl-sn-glycerol-3-phosphate acyltransferase
MSEELIRPRCEALTKKGNQCKNLSIPGSRYCRVHQSADILGKEPHFTEEETGDTPEEQNIIETDRLQLEEEINTGSVPDFDSRKQLKIEIETLISFVRERSPDYEPPPFSPEALIDLIRENLGKFSPEVLMGILETLKDSVNEDLLDVDTWKGIWYMINYSIEYQADIVKRRFTGDYETDEWGLDMEVSNAVEPFFNFLYGKYWRIETTGVENIPDETRAILVPNHSGQIPWDATMLAAAVYNEHPARRIIRNLYSSGIPKIPFVSTLLPKLGQVQATEENAVKLLRQEQVVAVFPEGHKGTGKLFRERYRLLRFGRGDFIRIAIKTKAPIIPVSIVGAEETYISLYKSKILANVLGAPYFPISPTWPWLGPLGLVPFPTKWFIDFGDPLPMDIYAEGSEADLLLVSQLTDRVRDIVQEMVYNRLTLRKSVFWG